MSKFRATLLTLFSAVVNTLLLTVFYLIYNKLIITHYGSHINGLISTLTQFVSMFTILEGGFSLAAVVASYEPIIKRNYEKLNNILYTTKKFLARIVLLYVAVTLLFGSIYVNFINSPIGLFRTYLLLLVTVGTTALSLGILPQYTIVLSGHNKLYIVTLVSVLSRLLTWCVSIVLILRYSNIVLVYSINFANILLNIFMLRLYEKRHFPYVSYKGKYEPISGTRDIMFQKITATIFTSTDLVLISVGINLAVASVYNVYNQIFQAVYVYLSSASNAPGDSFGQLLKTGNKVKASELFHIYQKIVQLFSTIFLTTAGITIIPFLRIYTNNVHDTNYIVPSLAILLYTYFYLKLNNVPFGLIINLAGLFKLQNMQCAVAAVVNLVSSVVLMHSIGIQGVVLGSVLGTAVITVVNIFKVHSVVDYLDTERLLFFLSCNYCIGLLMILISIRFWKSISNSYIQWFFVSAILFACIATLTIIINYILDKQTVCQSIKYFRTRILKK